MREISDQKFIQECHQYFMTLGFSEEQIEIILQKIEQLNGSRKSLYMIKEDMDAFSLLDFPEKERNEFICANAEIIFNKYSLNIHMKIKMLTGSYGNEEAINILRKCPAVIRYGMYAYEDKYQIYKREERGKKEPDENRLRVANNEAKERQRRRAEQAREERRRIGEPPRRRKKLRDYLD